MTTRAYRPPVSYSQRHTERLESESPHQIASASSIFPTTLTHHQQPPPLHTHLHDNITFDLDCNNHYLSLIFRY
ncbi:hypothetical protein HanRHA438_Chr04g0167991 [Helianthus annuus]|nr:hypothetical protein HanIR_Chr04g0170331 [Helianthus annuus]KAJ0926172.1 hypothetical protein HanRHA438_Chr04g0167991 [Helianthus annuus]